MARYVAKYQKYAIQARPQREVLTADGFPIVAQEQVVLEFEQASVQPWEIDEAIRHLGAQRGLPEGIDASYRLSVLDTEIVARERMWDEATRDFVESFLENSPNFNVDYIKVEKPRLSAPWPSYDEVKRVDHLVAKVRDLGFNPDDVIAYERENQAREDVISAFEQLRDGSPESDEILA